MESRLKGKRILLIDRHSAWRRRSAQGLLAAGADVTESVDYDFPPQPSDELLASGETSDQPGQSFDLVVLGCPSVRREERQLIRRILEHGYRLLVLPTSLPGLTMRSVFLTGADDVTDKPYDSAKLVNVVAQALEAIKPRDSYQAVAEEVLR